MYIYWWQKSFLIIDIQCDISIHCCKNSHLSTLSIYRLSTLSIYRRQIFNVCMVVTLSTRNLPKPGRFYTNFLSYCYSTMVVRNNDPAKTSKLPPLKKILHYIVSESRRGAVEVILLSSSDPWHFFIYLFRNINHKSQNYSMISFSNRR